MDNSPKTPLDKLLDRRFDSAREEHLLSSSFEKSEYGPYLKYTLESMQPLELAHTKRIYTVAGKVLQRIRGFFDERSVNIDLRYQGAVHTNTHVQLNNELDILAVLRPREKVEAYKSVEKLGTLLMSLFSGEPESFDKVDFSNKINIQLSTRRPNIQLNVLPTIWVDTSAYRESRREIDRGIAEYDFLNKTRKSFLPFRNMARINVKDSKANGNLKRLIRLIKNIQLDAEEKVDLSDYELACCLYNIHEKKLSVPTENLVAMLPAVANYLEKLGKTGMYRRIISPSRKELIFGNKEEKGEELIKLKHQLDQLLDNLKDELKSDQKTIDHSFTY